MQLCSYSSMDNVVRKRTTYCEQEINTGSWLTLKYDIKNKHPQLM